MDTTSGKNVARLRDAILLACLDKDHETARGLFFEALEEISSMELSKEGTNEAMCRMLESEIDIAEISTTPIFDLVSVVRRVNAERGFDEDRRREIVERGLSRLIGILPKKL